MLLFLILPDIIMEGDSDAEAEGEDTARRLSFPFSTVEEEEEDAEDGDILTKKIHQASASTPEPTSPQQRLFRQVIYGCLLSCLSVQFLLIHSAVSLFSYVSLFCV